MRRRSRAGGEPVKTRRKTAARKRGNAPKVAVRCSPPAGQETEAALFRRERDEAREQQKATAEILRVIRTSPADVQPVFETIVRNAVSLCGGLFSNVFRFDGELLYFVASHNVGPSYVSTQIANQDYARAVAARLVAGHFWQSHSNRSFRRSRR
jgi:hypothetical protein